MMDIIGEPHSSGCFLEQTEVQPFAAIGYDLLTDA
jgi:hypothetical protein